MNLYKFTNAVARRADKTVGLIVCQDIVEDHADVLNRPGTEEEFRSAFHRMLDAFAPNQAVAFILVPFRGYAMAQFILQIVTDNRRTPRAEWWRNPVLRSHLAAAIRHLVNGLCSAVAPEEKRPAAQITSHRAVSVRHIGDEVFLTPQDNACLQWGNVTSDASFVIALADRLRPLRNNGYRQAVLEMVRDEVAELPQLTLDDFNYRLMRYAQAPIAKA